MIPAAAELEIVLDRAEVLRLLGYPPGHVPPLRIEAMLAASLEQARRLARPRGVWQRLEPAAAAAAGIPGADGTGSAPSGFVLALATIGPDLEEEATGAARGGETTRALVLDAAGSAATEAAADALGRMAAARCGAPDADGGNRNKEAAPPCRISPGYGDWPLSAQRALFSLLPHEAVGVRLLPSLLMVPRKSISFGFWLDAEGTPVTAGSGCARCPLAACACRRKESCR